MEQDQRAKVRVLEKKGVSVDSSEQKEIPFFYVWASKMGIKTEELLGARLDSKKTLLQAKRPSWRALVDELVKTGRGFRRCPR